jgi:hypothetical protein
MRMDRPLEPPNTVTEKKILEKTAPRIERREIVPQTKCACDPFEAILDAYAENPERWDGLE